MPRITTDKIVKALNSSGGFISSASKMLGISRQTIYERIRKEDELQEVVTDIRESFLDLAETQLIKNIKAGDNASIFFFLKCQGKDRGYVERQEITGAGGKAIETEHTVTITYVKPKHNGELEYLKALEDKGDKKNDT